MDAHLDPTGNVVLTMSAEEARALRTLANDGDDPIVDGTEISVRIAWALEDVE